MKPLAVIAFALAVASTSFAASVTDPSCHGILYGVAVDANQKPASGVKLALDPLGMSLSYPLPTAVTDNVGAYRFEHLCAGRFTVLVDLEKEGYPPSIWTYILGKTGEVKLTAQRPTAELRVFLPPKAATLDVIVINSRNRKPITKYGVMLKVAGIPGRDWVTFLVEHGDSRAIALPSDTDLFCRISSSGFLVWPEGSRKGKFIRLEAGTRTILTVDLEPRP